MSQLQSKQPQNAHYSRLYWIILVAFIFLVAALGAYVYFFVSNKQSTGTMAVVTLNNGNTNAAGNTNSAANANLVPNTHAEVDTSGWRTYTDPVYQYVLTYPHSWYVDDPTVSRGNVELYDREPDILPGSSNVFREPYFTLRVTVLPRGDFSDPSNFARDRSLSVGAELVEEKELSIDGHAAFSRLIDQSGSPPTEQYYIEEVYIANGDNIILIKGFSTDQEIFQEFRPVFWDVIEFFRVRQ